MIPGADQQLGINIYPASLYDVIEPLKTRLSKREGLCQHGDRPVDGRPFGEKDAEMENGHEKDNDV